MIADHRHHLHVSVVGHCGCLNYNIEELTLSSNEMEKIGNGF